MIKDSDKTPSNLLEAVVAQIFQCYKEEDKG